MTETNPFERISNLRGQSVELGLWQVTRLLDRLDHPQREFPAVHVAGTNGKGSVCAMIEAQLRGGGHRVGLLTSPHLLDYSERIRVDGVPIGAAPAAAILDRLEEKSGAFDGSFFEVTTALAYEHFRRSDVDVAVLEVGLGGRLDATNVCFPRVSAITSIDLDHVKTLGADRAKIAFEKAGIIKPGVPVVVGNVEGEAMAVIRQVALRRNAPCIVASDEVEVSDVVSSWEGLTATVRFRGEGATRIRSPLTGRHQAENLAVAAVAARKFDPRPENRAPLLAGLAGTRWPGRLQRVAKNPVRVYDVAHNQAGAEAFADALEELGVPEGSVLVVGVLGDKELTGMAEALGRHFPRVVAATPPHPLRARPAIETAEAFVSAGRRASAHDEVASAIEEARDLRTGEGWIFVTGSLFTVGAAMRAFGDSLESPAVNLMESAG